MLAPSDAHPAVALAESGVTVMPGPLSTAAAFEAAASVIEQAHTEPLEVIGDFVIPPIDGPPSRDFQTLHFDFGLPLIPAADADVARYTALHVPAERHRSGARTRLVRVDALAAQRTWPDCHELLRRFAAYGDSHGAWADSHGYTEGSLARIVEAASAGSPVLPSVKQNPNFLCGDEFSSVAAELDFFAALGMSVQAVQVELTLEPGALMIFDNLALAHGRRGVRQPGELHQRVFGRRALPPSGQREMRDRVLGAFTGWLPEIAAAAPGSFS